jgi:phosphoglycolate phosphatase-like HAD superfamily hydrolase
MYRNIIWDLDGTLFDTYPAIAGAFQDAVRALGREADLDRILDLAQVSFDHCTQTLARECSLKPADIEREYVVHHARREYGEQRPFPGAREVCELVCSRHGKNLIVTHRGSRSTIGLLETHGLRRLFEGWITADDGYPKKPDPSAFEAALAMFRCDRADTMSVGDRDIDTTAARRAGLFTCKYGTLVSSARPDLEVTDYRQLRDFLRDGR